MKLKQTCLSLALAAVCAGASAELVTNGGFEAGTFSGWTEFGDPDYQNATNYGPYVHSGAYGGLFASPDVASGIFQSLQTVAGAEYEVSFWLSIGATATDEMSRAGFYWGGDLKEGFANEPAQAYSFFRYIVTATSSSTDLRFAFRHDGPGYFGLDDVSVVQRSVPPAPNPVSEPGTWALFALAAVAIRLTRSRRQG